MPSFGDTTSGIANFSEIIDIVNQMVEALELEFSVMPQMVLRREIPRGQDRVRIPYQTVTFEMQDHTDGDEIVFGQQMGIDTIDLTTSQLVLPYRLSSRALRFPAVDLAALCAEEEAKARAVALEVRLLSLLDDTGTQDLGDSASTDTNIGHVRQIRRMLRNIARASGGPAPTPWFGVINPIQEEDLLSDLGVVGATTGSTNTQARVIPGTVERMLEVSPSLDDAYFGTILKIPFFTSGYIGATDGSVTAPSIGGIFSKKALVLGVALDWDRKVFVESDWDGPKVRAITDYGARVGPFPSWVVQLDTVVT